MLKILYFKQADLMRLPEKMLNSSDSISSLHAIEHFGLGRYNDPIDIDGHIKAIKNIHKILIKGGRFYFSVPIGPLRIEFNAHRVFSVEYLLRVLTENFKVVKFSYVDDLGDLFENVDLNEKSVKSNFDCNYGCGIFELVKI
jgi:SAM-dependent methyltransferase